MKRKFKPKFVVAYGPFKLFLSTFGYSGVNTPWYSIYLLEHRFYDRKLRKHELVHVAQMRREGTLVMCVKYMYYLVVKGYWNNPYEVEARRIAGQDD